MKKLILMSFLLVAFFYGYAQKAHKTPEEKASMFSEKLGTSLSLAADQKKKVYDLTLEQQKSKDAILAKNAGNSEASKDELQKLRKSYHNSLKTILTPEQFSRWQKEKKERKGRKGYGNKEIYN